MMSLSHFDPSVICELARKADGAAVAQEASQHWPLIAGVQHSLEWIHVTTGCPWWLSIAMVTVAFRTLIFPFTLMQIKNSIKLSNAMPDQQAIKNQLDKDIAQGKDMETARKRYMEETAKIWEKHDCNPMKSLMPLMANGFLFVSFFIALRGLSEIKVPSMCYEGLLWFKDLTVADPFYALPVINSAIFLLTIELNAADGMQGQPPEMINRMKMFMRILSVVFIPITASFPTSMFCYWITSSCFSLVQSTLTKKNSVRRFLRLPPMKRRATDPFKSPFFKRPVKQVDVKGEMVMPKSFVPETEILPLTEKMTSVLKGQGLIKDGLPIVHMTRPKRKQEPLKDGLPVVQTSKPKRREGLAKDELPIVHTTKLKGKEGSGKDESPVLHVTRPKRKKESAKDESPVLHATKPKRKQKNTKSRRTKRH